MQISEFGDRLEVFETNTSFLTLDTIALRILCHLAPAYLDSNPDHDARHLVTAAFDLAVAFRAERQNRETARVAAVTE